MTVPRRSQNAVLCALMFGIAGAPYPQDKDKRNEAKNQAAKIIELYVKATGGVRALSGVQTLSLQGIATSSASTNSGTYTLETKLPNRYYSELVVGRRHFVEAYNGKSAWRSSSASRAGSLEDAMSAKPETMVSPDSVEMEVEAQIANSHLLNLNKSKVAVAFIGHVRVQDKDALQVEITPPAGSSREFYFDPESHLLVKESAKPGNPLEEIFLSDYRSEGGIRIPHKLELHRGPRAEDVYAIEITRVRINEPIGERVFDLPLASQVKLPDLKALFKEIDDNQKAIDKLKENYAGTRTEEATEYDSDNRVKKKTLNEFSFFYFDGEEISTATKREGKPLTEAEQKKETENAQKRVEELQKRRAKKEAKEQKAQAEGKEDKDDEVGIETFLRTCQFVNPRRERFRGQDVLVFDFEANPEYKPRNLEEKIVQKLAGVVWVDEKAHDVARLEAYFVGDAKIAGGLLASVQKGTGFVFEQEYVNDEVWLPTYEEAHIGARVLLLKGFRVGQIVRYSNYKKYHVEASSVIGSPKL